MKNDQLPNISNIGNGGRVRAECAQAIGYVETHADAATRAKLLAFFTACVTRLTPPAG